MKEYVIVLPIISGTKYLLLALKDKPEWQKGKLNLAGGLIEEGETPEQAAIRELKEESGLDGIDPVLCGKIVCDNCIIHCLYCTLETRFTLPFLNPRPEETQKIDWYHWDAIENDKRLIPNLKVIIPLLRMRTTGWTIIDVDKTHEFKMELN